MFHKLTGLQEKKMTKKQYTMFLLLPLLAGLVGGTLAAQFLVGEPAYADKMAESKKLVVAEEFRLVDKKGEVLSTWGMYAGGPGIVLFSKGGEYRAVFSLTSPEEGPILTLADKEGHYRTIMGLGAERQPYIALRDEEGRERLALTLNNEGEPALLFYDKGQNRRVLLGTVDLTKMKRTGTIERQSAYSLLLLNEKGKVVWKTP